MNVYPQDLGNSNYADVLNKRRATVGLSHKLTLKVAYSFPPAPLTPIQKLWMHGTATEGDAAEYAAPALDLCNKAAVQVLPDGFRWTFWKVIGTVFVINSLSSLLVYSWPLLASSWPLLLCLWPLLMLYPGVLRPRRVLKQMHHRLDYDDFAALASEARDPLAGDFFRLVQAATKMPEAENSMDSKIVRKAFYELGNSISLLPPLEVAAEDAAQLNAEAQQLKRQAQSEADQVVAASFHRRAEAVLQRAALAGHNNLISRRSQALRDELQEQIRALRAGLTATSLSSDHHSGRLADVAASIQQIAGQAISVATAQAELESVYAAPVALSIAKTQVPRRNS